MEQYVQADVAEWDLNWRMCKPPPIKLSRRESLIIQVSDQHRDAVRPQVKDRSDVRRDVLPRRILR
jgi:hypothetical protein